jgi:selenocysteine lyase/cysteine desulfurase
MWYSHSCFLLLLTGLGALLVRKTAAGALRKVYFGGGSVDYCTAQDAWHVLSAMPAGEHEFMALLVI